jgi:hypothetical protein
MEMEEQGAEEEELKRASAGVGTGESGEEAARSAALPLDWMVEMASHPDRLMRPAAGRGGVSSIF